MSVLGDKIYDHRDGGKTDKKKYVKIFYPPRTDRNAYRNMRTTHTRIYIAYLYTYYIIIMYSGRVLYIIYSHVSDCRVTRIKGRAPVVLRRRRRQLDRERSIAQHPYTQSVRPCLRVCVCACVLARARARPSPFILVSALTGGHFPI